jgi:8-oxo-dGTP diphosphatase
MSGSSGRADPSAVFGVGVQCIVREAGRILFGRRLAVFGHGSWGLPGGQLEHGETFPVAALRELEEETALVGEGVEVVALADATAENNFHVQIGCLITAWHGTPRNVSPDTCSELAFFALDSLPAPLFVASAPLIDRFRRGVLY